MADKETYTERTVLEQPAVVRREIGAEPARSGGSAGWWIAALVAIVAVVGVFMVMNGSATQTDLQAARETGRAEANLDAATQRAQDAAVSASEASRQAAASMSESTQAAAANARAAAESATNAAQTAATSAADSAQDASTSEPAPQP